MKPTQGNYTKNKRLELFQDEKDLQKFLEQNFAESLKQLIKVTARNMIKHEMEIFRQQLDKKISFNGHYERNMLSSFGKIEGIPVPRFRQGIEGLNLRSLGIFNQEKEKFMRLVEQMHLLGISQRKIKKLAKICLGVPISVNRVGSICKELAEQESLQINQRPLNDDFVYLLFDGLWGKTKGYGWEDNKSVLLCALGIRANGEREIIGFSLSRHEDTQGWKELIGQLNKRGLKGDNLQLVIIDDTAALKKAVEVFYPKAQIQICIAHKIRNILGKTSRKSKRAVADDLKMVFESQRPSEAIEKAKAMARKWYQIEPKAVESLRFNIESCFTYFNFSRELWTKIRTTNILEREFREVRRRIKVFDNTFQNEDSAERYANSIFNYLNCNYPQKLLHTKS